MKQFFWRVVGVCLLFQAAVAAVVCLGCALVISQLYHLFSDYGVVDIWYQLLVTLPIAMLAVPSLMKLYKRIMKFKRDYSRWMQESSPDKYGEETETEVKIDDNGIGFVNRKGEPQKLNWEDMTLAIAMKDFYAFMDDCETLVGMPKYAVDETLREYLTRQLQRIKKRQMGNKGLTCTSR